MKAIKNYRKKLSMDEKIEEFRFWVDYIPDHLYYFIRNNPDFEKSLDYSIESLNFLEDYLLKTISFKGLKSQKDFHERLAMYIGETFIKNMEGAYWDIEFEKKDYIYKGIPIIKRHGHKGLEDCPHYMVLTALSRKTGKYLSTLFNKMNKAIC